MLTKRELEGFGWIFEWCCRTGLLPYQWNSKTRRIHALSQRSKVYAAVAVMLFQWSYCAFKMWRIPGFLKTPNWKSEGTVYFVYQVCWITVSSMAYNSVVQKAGVTNVVNNLIEFNMRQGKRYLGTEFAKPSIREKCVLMSLASLANFMSCCLLFFCVFPNQHHFLYSAITAPSKVWFFWTFFLLEAYAAWVLVMIYAFGIVIQFMYIVTMKFWLNKVCIEWPSQEGKIPKKSIRPQELLKLYRRLMLINAEFNRSHGYFVTPVIIVTMTALAALSSYSTIRFSDSLPIPMSIVNVFMFVLATTQLIVGTNLAASLHTRSGACQQHLRDFLTRHSMTDEERRRCLREVKTCKPFGFQVGSCYVIKQETKMTILNFLINVVAYLLVGQH